MRAARLAADPLWQCLCPSWAQAPRLTISRPTLRAVSKQPALRCLLSTTRPSRTKTSTASPFDEPSYSDTVPYLPPQHATTRPPTPAASRSLSYLGFHEESIEALYSRLRSVSNKEDALLECRAIAEHLVRERKQKPNLDIYNALITSNISAVEGSAWRVSELLDEMDREGLQPDLTTCHAVLKVLSVHPDHLLRADILAYMRGRWYQVLGDGEHDIAASLWRSGLYEQALFRMDKMKAERMLIDPWLKDLAVHCLCLDGEVPEATKMMRSRHEANEPLLSSRQTLWNTLLDAAAYQRHYGGTYLVWTTQVRPGYLNPSSGTCLNAMATVAKVGDAALATEIFSHLSKRAIQFHPVHYELLISSYMVSEEPDLERALTVLAIMANDKFEVTSAETRSIARYLAQDPAALVPRALAHLRKLQTEGRKIPPAALNVLIESLITPSGNAHTIREADLKAALSVYKQMHTFASSTDGDKKTWANVETFNLLLKSCRQVDVPDAGMASFLASELLALRIRPNALTFDRLILVFVEAASKEAKTSADPGSQTVIEGSTYIDWAWRHFCDMHSVGFAPRGVTVRQLAVELASIGNEHCWDVLQMAEDMKDRIESWMWTRAVTRQVVEQAWEKATSATIRASSSGDMAVLEAAGSPA